MSDSYFESDLNTQQSFDHQELYQDNFEQQSHDQQDLGELSFNLQAFREEYLKEETLAWHQTDWRAEARREKGDAEIERRDFLRSIHYRVLDLIENYKSQEVALIKIFQEVDDHRVFVLCGYRSLFSYATEGLKLSENVAFNYILIARKAKTVPALLESIAKNEITISKARRICAVIDERNQDHWLELAKSLNQKQIEKEVAKINPKSSIQESMTFVSENLLQVTMAIGEETMKLLKRVQDLESQRTSKAVGYDGTVKAALLEYLKKHDPNEKAKRYERRQAKKETTETKKKSESEGNLKGEEEFGGRSENSSINRDSELKETSNMNTAASYQNSKTWAGLSQVDRNRTPIPKATLHQVHLRDGGRCTYIQKQSDGVDINSQLRKRCDQTRWIDTHHIIPVHLGGTNHIDNLTTLCRFHHLELHNH